MSHENSQIYTLYEVASKFILRTIKKSANFNDILQIIKNDPTNLFIVENEINNDRYLLQFYNN